jgi:hypothetical protein
MKPVFAALLAGLFFGGTNPYPTIGAIPLPTGFHRISAPERSFCTWLRNVPLKKDRTVYLFDGTPKRNQDAQFAVLDISVGHTDLQQCADAVMRLRAEYLYASGDLQKIEFKTGQGVRLNFLEWCTGDRARRRFDRYLKRVFEYCGTWSLERQLRLRHLDAISAGDVLIKGGFPGHAMLVVDIAEDGSGHRIYLLAQSYMPAQDIHIVRNLAEPGISPWYRADPAETQIETPEWTFTTNQLRTWP